MSASQEPLSPRPPEVDPNTAAILAPYSPAHIVDCYKGVAPTSFRGAVRHFYGELGAAAPEQAAATITKLQSAFHALVDNASRMSVEELHRLSELYSNNGLTAEAETLVEQSGKALDRHIAINSAFRTWHNPLSQGDLTLRDVRNSLKPIAAEEGDIPEIIRITENPEYAPKSGPDPFPGRVNLYNHDSIHMVLGRGLLAMDEAFVIGFTMGTTDSMTTDMTEAYARLSRDEYPKPYNFTDHHLWTYRRAVMLGHISEAISLSTVDFTQFEDKTLNEIRATLNIETPLLRAFYEIEKRYFEKVQSDINASHPPKPSSIAFASSRLLD